MRGLFPFFFKDHQFIENLFDIFFRDWNKIWQSVKQLE